jgi:hypothetical protein
MRLEEKRQQPCFAGLPNELLINIFLHLSIKDLCNMRLVSKCWREIVTQVWLSKQTLVLSEENIFNSSSPTSEGKKASIFYLYANILNKINCSKLVHLEICTSNNNRKLLSVYDFAKTLALVSQKCSNLQSLSIKSSNKFQLGIFPNNSLSDLIRRCPHLTHVNLKNAFGLVDSSIETLFDSCQKLKSLNLSNCSMIIGICFKKVNKALREITLDYCDNMGEENLVKLFNQNKNLRYLSLNGVNIGPRVFYYVINNLKMLEVFKISKHNFDFLSSFFSGLKDESEQFLNTSLHLTKLDLSYNLGNNQLFASILKNCVSLKCLYVDYCKNLTDEMFTTFRINSPLEELHLTGLNVTDVTLQTLSQLKNSLKKLVISRCHRVSSREIGHTLERLKMLDFYDVQSTSVDNFILFIAYNLVKYESRKIYILCQKTQIDFFEFNILYPNNHLLNSRLEFSNIISLCPDANDQYSTDMLVQVESLSVELTRPEFSTFYDLDWQRQMQK